VTDLVEDAGDELGGDALLPVWVSDPGGKQHDAAADDPVWKLGDGVLIQDLSRRAAASVSRSVAMFCCFVSCSSGTGQTGWIR
jgi:hypothetical protein